ncbi:MAG TPA: zf-HC2 domain-containing protein [Blastocatellia bacterium]|nr:zf-HC2 domain-containing protein [Blastocatellia bacterium]
MNEETLQAYLDGEAPVDVAGGVIAHLAVCASCAARAREAERAMAAIGGAIDDESPVAIPTARLRARIESAMTEKPAESAAPSFTPRNIFWRAGLIAASALVVTGVLVWFWGWFLSRSYTTPGARQPAHIAQEKAPSDLIANPSGPQQSSSPSAPVRARGRSKSDRPRFIKKPAFELAQTYLPEPSALAPAPTAGFSDSASFFDLETTRHLEKAQTLLRSFKNASSPTAEELAYDKQESRELLLRNILLRREAEGSENAPAKSLLGGLEPFLLDIANLPARPAAGDLASVKRRIRKSEIVVALQVYSTPTASLD